MVPELQGFSNMRAVPQLLNQDDSIRIARSTLADGLGLPLGFGQTYIALLVCVEGCARFTINFKERAVRRHHVLVLAEDTIALLRRRSRRFAAFVCLMPKSRAAEVAYPLPSSLFVFLHQHPHCIPALADAALLSGWLAQMEDAAGHCPQHGRTMLRNLLQNFFLKVAERVSAEDCAEPEFSRGEILSWRFWELVGRHSTQRREVSFYAEALSITPFYLSQLSRKFFNDSPKGLIDWQVVQEIKSLLAYGDLSIGQLADKLRFEDASYLCRYFKRHTGMSLTAYRKAARGSAPSR